MELIGAILQGSLILLVLFLPSIHAERRNHNQCGTIEVINLASVGWLAWAQFGGIYSTSEAVQAAATAPAVLGWIIAFAWSFSHQPANGK